MVEGMTDSVTVDEAGILRDFFRIQSDKHGPELLRRLDNIQYGEDDEEERRTQGMNMEQVVEEVIKQEINTEAVLRNSSPDSECSSEGPVPENVALAFGTNNMGPLLMGPGGLILSLPYHEHSALGELLRLQQGGLSPPSGHRVGVSVIQKAPNRGPTLYLERRNTQSPGAVNLQNSSLQLLKRKSETGNVGDSGPVVKRRSNQQQSDHLICEVCGERAGKHSYYGGQVCPSCRAFFRRSVQSRYNETFKCSKGLEDCEISLITRKNCQYCRYQRCVSAGMRPSWILSDEERVRRFHGRTKAGKGEGGRSTSPPRSPEERASPLSRTVSPNPYSGLTEEDRARILSYGELMLQCLSGHPDLEDLEPSLLIDLLQVTLHGTSLSGKTALQVSYLLEHRTRNGLTLLPEFQALPPRDQLRVIQHNLPLVHRFRQALCLARPNLSWKKLVEIFVGEEKLRSCEENVPHDLSGKSSHVRPMEYRDLLASSWCQSSPEIEHHLKSLVKELAASLDLEDEIQIILIALIIAFCPDFLDLGGRSAVEQTQLKFVLLLQAHLASSSSCVAVTKLAKTLMVPAIARQIHQVSRERLII